MPTLVVLEEYRSSEDEDDPEAPEQGELVVHLHSSALLSSSTAVFKTEFSLHVGIPIPV